MVVELKKVDGLQKCNLLIWESEEFKIMEKNVIIITWKSTVTLLAFKFSKRARFLSISAYFGWIAKSRSRRSYFHAFLSSLINQKEVITPLSSLFFPNLLPMCKFISSISWPVKTSNGSYLIEKESPRM